MSPRDRVDGALEWLLTFAHHKAVDFLIVTVVLFTFVYLTWQVIRWAH